MAAREPRASNGAAVKCTTPSQCERVAFQSVFKPSQSQKEQSARLPSPYPSIGMQMLRGKRNGPPTAESLALVFLVISNFLPQYRPSLSCARLGAG